MSSEPSLITFGCRLNAFESELIKTHAHRAGLSDIVFINTCAVTAEAERQARQTVRRLKRENPTKKIVVTGCSAQVNAKLYETMPEVSYILGNQEKLDPNTYKALKEDPTTKVHLSDIMAVKESAPQIVTSMDGLSRAYVQVQNGCDHRCTFCTIPFGRGNSRSVPMGHLFTQVQAYVENGYQEVVLTGVDITSYGHDLPGTPTLGQMSRRLLAFAPNLKRLRLSSVDPVEIDEDIFTLLATSERFMPYLHISLQAGDDLILKRMKRRHLRADLLAFCQKARAANPNVTFGADIIAGFPTETDAQFNNTLAILRECDITFAHIFPYSSRPGTPAARMPQVQPSVIKDRAKRLRQEAEHVRKEHFQRQVGKKQSALVEKDTFARAENFMPIQLQQSQKVGQIIEVEIIGATSDALIGQPLEIGDSL